MAGRRINRLGVPRRRAVTAAIVRRAQVRAAFDYFSRYRDLGLAWIKACSLGPAARVFGNAARFRHIGLVLLRIPVGCPFPDVADHVVEAVAVGRERGYGRSALEAIFVKVLTREFTLPGIRHELAARRELVAPREFGTLQPTTGGEFPLRLGRKPLAGPFRIGLRVAVRDVYDRMIVKPADRAARSIGPAPVGAELETPPLTPVAQIDRLLGRSEDQRSGL